MKRGLLAGLCLLTALIAAPMAAGGDRTPVTILAPDLPGASEVGERGRDIEIVATTLRQCGYEPEFIVQPFGRHLWSFRYMTQADGVMTVPLDYNLPGHSTAAYVWDQDGAFYNASRIDPIEGTDDLRGLNVVTFRDGLKILGIEEMADGFSSLLMVADQGLHSKLLFKGRVDVILADGLIVAEVNDRILRNHGTGQSWPAREDDFRFAPIFIPSPYKMVFRDSDIARQFDECFDRLFHNGVAPAINEKYMEAHQEELKHRYLAQ